ncbi:MAG: hydroxymyristoyl-ACP dehydratase [Candidatus Contendobacter odensis]|uniref:Hydroxymyristoyl-ACP dehydratase n=1 Tax=Candidatus Contendibacter odensensis TaxID=1400860 RepID=A0A2G6PFT0_9GAMM|nr:MAG: hydroxymyristoyl-ACP dehydratase [Candidatus Contendobacter odensis]
MNVIAAHHPCLAGHFPDQPIVPGTLILEKIVQAFTDQQPDMHPTGIPMVKFLTPLRPEQTFIIHFAKPEQQRVRFECIKADGQVIVRGLLAVAY